MAKAKQAIFKPKLPKIFVGSSSEAREKENPRDILQQVERGRDSGAMVGCA
jgi:hypothetical protein